VSQATATRQSNVPVTVVIPARFGSSRFPGKPLAHVGGKPLIQHVYERVSAAASISNILVATDDLRILDAVTQFGGSAVLMDGAFRTGTDRVAAVAAQRPGEIFINLQGDEIVLHPGLLTDLIQAFLDSDAPMGTLKRRLTSAAEVLNPSVVKVITQANGDALYFSRAPIPHLRDAPPGDISTGLYYIHLGIYIYRRQALLSFTDLPTGRLEEAEKLEQLRALEHGIPIRVWETEHPSLRVDAPEDVKVAAEKLLHVRTDSHTKVAL
jgi:3-deoxy-manno-octulosonate cytidylyltransferase (CMP-KDO synthetase)